jgi:hypothetical protein
MKWVGNPRHRRDWSRSLAVTTLCDVLRSTSDVRIDDILTNNLLITTPGRFFRRTLRPHILSHLLCHRENPFVIEPFAKAAQGP